MILQTKSLFISAGHSASDPGAVANGTSEAEVVTEFRDRLAHYLSDKLVFGTDGDVGENLPLRQAVALASRHDVAVEFHCNAASPAATGVETLSKRGQFPFAGRICTAISDTLGIRNRGSKPENSGQHSRLAFVSDGGGLILELFFISSPDDLRAYYHNRQALVQAVAAVLIDEVTA